MTKAACTDCRRPSSASLLAWHAYSRRAAGPSSPALARLWRPCRRSQRRSVLPGLAVAPSCPGWPWECPAPWPLQQSLPHRLPLEFPRVLRTHLLACHLATPCRDFQPGSSTPLFRATSTSLVDSPGRSMSARIHRTAPSAELPGRRACALQFAVRWACRRLSNHREWMRPAAQID